MKRRIAAAIIICIMLWAALMSGCGKEKKTESYIGIISAMDNEIRPTFWMK